MKRILLVLATLVFSSLTLFAQQEDFAPILEKCAAFLNQEVQRENKVSHVTYDKRTNTIDFCAGVMEDAQFNAMKKQVKANPSILDGEIHKRLFDNGRPNELLTILSRGRASFNFLMKNKKTGETLGKKLDARQIESLVVGKDGKKNKEALKAMIANWNKKLPKECLSGAKLQRVSMKENAVVLLIQRDEQKMNMEEFMKKENYKKVSADMDAIIKNLVSNKEIRPILELLVKMNYDLRFCFIGNRSAPDNRTGGPRGVM